jgi:hypothetical protein
MYPPEQELLTIQVLRKSCENVQREVIFLKSN